MSEVAAARGAAERWLAERSIGDELADRVVIVVSELATNAIRHARTAFVLDLDSTDAGGLRVTMFDMDSRQPLLVGTDDEATSGRGLQIVAALADDWGSNTDERDDI